MIQFLQTGVLIAETGLLIAETSLLRFLVTEGTWLLVISAIVLGAIVGSFLNVVIYRLPVGESIVYPPSRCGACGRPIRMRDNIPVLSWLLLRGRCRDCQATIAIRYPMVEALAAAISLGLIVSHVLRQPTVTAAEAGLARYLFHLLLVYVLLCASLIQIDGHPIPLRLWIGPAVLGWLLPAVFLPLRMPLLWQVNGPEEALLVGLIGAAAAMGVAALMKGINRTLPWSTPLAVGVMLGVFLGPAAAILLTLGALASGSLAGRRRLASGFTGGACLLTFVYLIAIHLYPISSPTSGVGHPDGNAHCNLEFVLPQGSFSHERKL